MVVQLFNSALQSTFVATAPFQVAANSIPLEFILTVTGVVAARVQWYLEYTDEDPNASASNWYQEVDEQDTGNGIVTHSAVVRTFQLNGGAFLSAGVYKFAPQFKRLAPYARVQVRAAAGTVAAVIGVSAGTKPVS